MIFTYSFIYLIFRLFFVHDLWPLRTILIYDNNIGKLFAGRICCMHPLILLIHFTEKCSEWVWVKFFGSFRIIPMCSVLWPTFFHFPLVNMGAIGVLVTQNNARRTAIPGCSLYQQELIAIKIKFDEKSVWVNQQTDIHYTNALNDSVRLTGF